MVRFAMFVLAAFGPGGRRVVRRGAVFALAAAAVGILAGDASALGKRKKMAAYTAAATTDCGCGGSAAGYAAGGGYYYGTAYPDTTRYGGGYYAPVYPNAGGPPFTDGGGPLRPVPIPFLPNR